MANPHCLREQALIAYLVYGDNPDYQAEAAFSIASARALLRREPYPVEIVVITDQPRFVYPIDARRIHISTDELRDWTRGGRLNHRAKLCALARLVHEPAWAVALIDTDTYFVAHPAGLFARIFPSQSVMHADEGPLAHSTQWQELLTNSGLANLLRDHGCFRHTALFNSGVIGLHAAHAMLAERALAWFDAHSDTISAFDLEQVAVSVVLQHHTRVVASDDLLVHYWGFARPFVHVQIKRALAEGKVDVHGLGIPRARLRVRLRSRLVSSVMHWDPDCRFTYHAMLAAMASRAAADGYTEVWSEVAIEALSHAREMHGREVLQTPGLRRSLRPLERAAWLSPALRQRWNKLWSEQAAGPS